MIIGGSLKVIAVPAMDSELSGCGDRFAWHVIYEWKILKSNHMISYVYII